MKENSATNPLHWGPRVLGLLYALFLSLFAFDSWEGVSSFWEGLVGFFIHLLPVYIILFLLVVGWRWPRWGGVGFLILAVAFTLVFGWRDPLTILLLGGPPVLIGVLFLLDSRAAGRNELNTELHG